MDEDSDDDEKQISQAKGTQMNELVVNLENVKEGKVDDLSIEMEARKESDSDDLWLESWDELTDEIRHKLEELVPNWQETYDLVSKNDDRIVAKLEDFKSVFANNSDERIFYFTLKVEWFLVFFFYI